MINKIINNDCMVEFNKISDKSINLLLTDIPFDEVNRESNGIRVFDKRDADILNFNLSNFVSECIRVTNGSIYIFCGIEQISIIKSIMIKNKMSTRLIIWEKTNPSPINGEYIWLSGIECCVFGKFSNATFNGHCKNTVLRYPSGSSKLHPTEKNINLIRELIKISSNDGDLVLDPCLGSGTVALACKQLGRNFIGIEINKKYCDIARKRLVQSNLDSFNDSVTLEDF